MVVSGTQNPSELCLLKQKMLRSTKTATEAGSPGGHSGISSVLFSHAAKGSRFSADTVGSARAAISYVSKRISRPTRVNTVLSAKPITNKI